MDQALGRQAAQHAAPGLDQLLVDRVELVGLGLHVLQPVPLHDGRLVERRRRVGVVFEQLGRAAAVVGEVEAAADRRIGAPPDPFEVVAPGRRDAHALPELARHDVLDRLEAHAVQLLGRGFELVDLVGREGVAGLLGPVRLAVHDVVVEAELLELVLPARAWRHGFAAHRQLDPDEPPVLPVEPKPPRWLWVVAGADLAGRWLRRCLARRCRGGDRAAAAAKQPGQEPEEAAAAHHRRRAGIEQGRTRHAHQDELDAARHARTAGGSGRGHRHVRS